MTLPRTDNREVPAADTRRSPASVIFDLDGTLLDPIEDMQTARSAGMVAVGALWGFRTAEELLRHGAKHLVPQPPDILDLPEWKAGGA